ncbi:ATP-binding protein [Streptosporangium sp. NPDC002544]|uniref:ATP-binding protein n=1 Tax=Streptosporangium sp. NPDC002544 TaxID=3154538 RepID=UPI00331B5CBF
MRRGAGRRRDGGVRRLPHRRGDLPAAARLLTAHLDGQATAETLETLELLVSEVVTNAVLHSDSARPGGLVTVRVGLGDSLIHIEVIDDGSATSVPAIRTADDDSLTGRGLSWVNLLASRWGSSRHDETGGTVWFQLGHSPLSSH